MGWLRCSRASSASDPLASRKPVNSFKQSDTALFQPHTPTQRHVRPQPGIQAAHPDRLLRSLLRAPVPHIPTRPCRDIPPVRPLLSYEQVIPTHLTLPEPTSTHPVLLHQNPPWTRAAKTKSSFEGGQPCERVQRSKAGGCQPRSAIPNAPSKPKPSPSTSCPAPTGHPDTPQPEELRPTSKEALMLNPTPTRTSKAGTG